MLEPAAITTLIEDWRRGDRAARDRLMTLMYDECRAIAASVRRRYSTPDTLSPTALVHELHLRLAQSGPGNCQHRAHFKALAARVVHHVIVDYLRRGSARKHGGDATRVPMSTGVRADDPTTRLDAYLSLDEAIAVLWGEHPRQARIIEYRFFGGMTNAETAEAMAVSRVTVERDWAAARAWLRKYLACTPAARPRTQREASA